MIRLFVWGIIVFFTLTSFRSPNWRYEKIGNSDGLSNSAVTSVYFDSKGYIWFGTWDGLNRYDGTRIRVFKPDIFQKGSISNNIIRRILEDKSRNLWVVTENGLNLYNPEKELFTSFFVDQHSSEYRENRFHTALDPDSVIWCSKYDYGVTRYDPVKKQFSAPLRIENQPAMLKKTVGFAFSTDGFLWCLTNDSTLYGIKDRDVVKRINLGGKNIDPEKNWFFKFKGQLFVLIALKKGGLLRLNLCNGATSKIQGGNKDFHVTTLSESPHSHDLWGGTDGGRVFRIEIDGKDVCFLGDQLSVLAGKQIKIWTVTETRPDLLWIGTDGDGVYKYIMKGNYFVSVGKGDPSLGMINHNIVRAIHEDRDGNLWVGTRGNGLNFLPASGGTTRIFDTRNGLSNNAVLSLGEDSSGNIWIGVDGPGIDMYEPSTGEIFHFPDDFKNKPVLNFGSVYAICNDSFGDLWIGTSGYGLYRFSVRKDRNNNYILRDYRCYRNRPGQKNGLFSNIVYSIMEGSPNVLWIGTRGGGLYRLNTVTDEFEAFLSSQGNPNCLNNNDVLSLWKSENKQELWIGTSGGLNKMNLATSPYQFSHYTEHEGLPNNTVHAILGDKKGNIWVSTNKGLAKLNDQNGEVRYFYSSDGLQSNEYTDGASCLGKHSGLFFFGGVNGFDLFDPDRVRDSDYFPRLAITGFTLFNHGHGTSGLLSENIDMVDSLSLKYNQNFFRFDFTSLNYHSSGKCRYAYKLENFNSDFLFADKNNSAMFTNVPPGEYTFTVRWTNEDGVWNKSPYHIRISVLPPFWRTSLAYALYAVILLVVLVFIAFSVRHRVRVRQKMTEERMEIRKTKEMNQYKFQFFTNIAHEFRTPLTLIMAPAAQLMDLKGEDHRIAPYVKSIYNNSVRLLHLIQELIDFRKVETGNLRLNVRNGNFTCFVRALVDAFRQYAANKKIDLRFFHADSGICGWFDNKVMEKVFLNLISNALKYTPEGGTVSVRLSQEENFISVSVEDTGVGIPDEYQEKIFDRFFQQHGAFAKGRGIAVDSAGVGLSLTKSLVDLHKGTIRLKSSAGEGSCFTVTFPAAEENYSEKEKHDDMLIDETRIQDKASEEFMDVETITYGTDEKEAGLSGKNRDTVLVVDDNEQLRNLIFDILHHDYDVLNASNGLEALHEVEVHEVSVVVTDIIMPDMDGLELCRHIKDNIHTCHIPVILLTAKGELEQRIEGIESGADSYIPKPFDPRHLRVRIRKLIENKNKIRRAFRSGMMDMKGAMSGFSNRDTLLLDDLYGFIDKNIDNEELDANELAGHLNMSKTQLYRKIKALTGFTPHGLIKNYRLKKAVELLRTSSLTVSEIIYETGFKNRTYFYRSFKEMYGTSPMDYVKKG